jgi:hypothetical protein
MAVDRAAQVRIHLSTKSEDIALPETGPILVSTGKPANRVLDVHGHIRWFYGEPPYRYTIKFWIACD